MALKFMFLLVSSKLQSVLKSAYSTDKQEAGWNGAVDVFPQSSSILLAWNKNKSQSIGVRSRFFPSFFCFFASARKDK